MARMLPNANLARGSSWGGFGYNQPRQTPGSSGATSMGAYQDAGRAYAQRSAAAEPNMAGLPTYTGMGPRTAPPDMMNAARQQAMSSALMQPQLGQQFGIGGGQMQGMQQGTPQQQLGNAGGQYQQAMSNYQAAPNAGYTTYPGMPANGAPQQQAMPGQPVQPGQDPQAALAARRSLV